MQDRINQIRDLLQTMELDAQLDIRTFTLPKLRMIQQKLDYIQQEIAKKPKATPSVPKTRSSTLTDNRMTLRLTRKQIQAINKQANDNNICKSTLVKNLIDRAIQTTKQPKPKRINLGKPPFGYHIKNSQLVANPQEKPVIDTILQLYYKNYTYKEIIQTVHNLHHRSFTRNTIAKILDREIQQRKYQ